MKNEYIIINKTNIQKRIEELESKIIPNPNFDSEIDSHNLLFVAKQNELNKILSHSTPLIPEIEKAWKSGEEYGVCDWADFMGEPAPINKQDYISILLHNLKLDI